MGSGELLRSPLNPNFAAQDVPPKPPVTHQTEPWVLECRRLVVLEEEVADPGECVSLDERYRYEPPPSCNHGSEEQRNGNARAGEVQSPAGSVGVLTKVKGIEIAEGMERVLVVQGVLRKHGLRDTDIGNPVLASAREARIHILIVEARSCPM